MHEPTMVNLIHKELANGSFQLFIEPISGCSYIWQHCKAGTAVWEKINTLGTNTFTTPYNANSYSGDKYRCLVISRKKVIAYSSTLTIGKKTYERGAASSNYTRREEQYQDYEYSPSSVADTDGMDGHQFEAYCAEVLANNGFSNVRVTPGSGDFGIDILAEKDSITYAIQCKCYTSAVGNKAVQEAYSGKAFYNSMVAAVLTNNYFTEAAIETARRNAVILWDRDYLDNMIRNPGKGSSESSNNHNSYSEKHEGKAADTMPDFFKGCSEWNHVKERYRKLMQAYHPDLSAGDEEYAKAINDQYEKLKKKYGQ